VLNDISLDIDEGEFLALMGPSGSGRRPLNLIAGIDRADSGTVKIGVSISPPLRDRTCWLAGDECRFIFQFYNLIPVLTAFGNVEPPSLDRSFEE
jgi:putative ABC transport system ATP-binding protein